MKKISYSNFKIIIVDNASTNNSLEKISSELNNTIILKSNHNLGFAGGNNIGIQYALKDGAQYILLLNNDTLVQKDFLGYMVKSFSTNKNAGIVGCKIMNFPQKDKIWYCGGRINWFKFIGEHFVIEKDNICEQEIKCDFVTGCCMLIKKEVFEEVGMLPEDYFMYFEDVDFCVKVSENKYDIVYNPKSIIYHKVGTSGGGKQSSFSIRWCTRNRLIFMKRYRERVKKSNFFLSNVFFFTSRFIKIIMYIIKFQFSKAMAIIQGIMDAHKYKVL
ncbi:glycosyltransferase family 2 protein [Clostridium guangxiense]|nr:glycosyltransferase family 2 protein [Clostridium guangxiense]